MEKPTMEGRYRSHWRTLERFPTMGASTVGQWICMAGIQTCLGAEWSATFLYWRDTTRDSYRFYKRRDSRSGKLQGYQLPYSTGTGTYVEPSTNSPGRTDNRTGSAYVGIHQCICPDTRRRTWPTLGTLWRSVWRITISGSRIRYWNGAGYATQSSGCSYRKTLYRL